MIHTKARSRGLAGGVFGDLRAFVSSCETLPGAGEDEGMSATAPQDAVP